MPDFVGILQRQEHQKRKQIIGCQMKRREERNIYREHVCVCWGATLIVLWPHDYMYVSKLIEMYTKR